MNQSYLNLESRITELLRSYGQDLAVAKLPPNVQPFGTPELLVAAVAITAWLLQTALRPVIEHMVKRKLPTGQKVVPPEELRTRLEQLEGIARRLAEREKEMMGRLEETRACLSAVFEEIESSRQIALKVDDDSYDGLVTYLVQLGLTRRRAQRLSQEVVKAVQSSFLSNKEELRDDHS